MTRRVAIVPHTHWDREWYSPFQTFRLRLVDLLDGFLPQIEKDLSYARFLLDGQMAVVDDYLEVRPQARSTLRSLAAAGRLSVGPWYILMDEFLVSGETIVRNLQKGLAAAGEFGGAMEVGYLPDMFGHVAQMPQILRRAGMEHAVVWRGVPSEVDRTAFWWSAPDGSTVRAEYLVRGYGNGSAIPDDAKALVRRLEQHEEQIGGFLLDERSGEEPANKGPILFMNGTDHQVPQRWLGRVVAEVNALQDDYALEVTSLAEFLPTAPTEGLPAWTGELRSGARANLLMGVASNRVDVKQAAARTERALERRAEPLCALFLPPDRYPTAMFDLAWTEVIRNSAHDSICACSDDEVGAAVMHRFAEARQIGDGLGDRAVRALRDSIAEEGAIVVNPSARTRGGVLQVTLPGEGAVEHAQILSVRDPVRMDLTLTGEQLAAVMGDMRSQQLDDETFINAVEIEETADLLEITLQADARLRRYVPVEEVKRDIAERIAGRPDLAVRVRVLQPPSRQVVARIERVPGYGWSRFEAVAVDPVVVEGTTLRNGLVKVAVDSSDGTFSLNGVAGLCRLVDDGDQGDTYNYSPPATDTVIDAPQRVDVEVMESGPVRARVAVSRSYRWPEKIDDQLRARVGEREVTVTTTYEVRAGEPFVRVGIAFENPCRDHRLRAWFPLKDPASTSRAECAFAIVERGLEAEGGPSERALATYPSRRFVSAGTLTIAHEGLLEYELVDGGGALALTLLRATGWLSRVEMYNRPMPAGPAIRLDAPQMVGPVHASFVVALGHPDPYVLVDDAFLALEVVHARGGGERPSSGQVLSVEGAEVSALQRVAEAFELRVFNPTAAATEVRVDGRSGWLVDLRGRPLEPFEGSFPLGPFAIATARLSVV